MTYVPRIVSIVEGHGEGERHAVAILIERIAASLGLWVDCYHSFRTQRNRFPRFDEERRRQMLAARARAGQSGAILVLLDSDGEPPCTDWRHRLAPCLFGDALQQSLEPLAGQTPFAVVWAHREFESWFVAAAPSLVRERCLQDDVQTPSAPDSLRDAKGWLTERMRDGREYKPGRDQAAFTRFFDLQMARERSPSFDHAHTEIERLLRIVHGP